jgi:hypothetical protein
LSQAPLWEDPVHAVALELNRSAGHVPDVPVQDSATSHWPAAARHVTALVLKTSKQVLAVPEQWSAASLSQAPPCDAPVQEVPLELNTSAGHVPDAPVHVSAASHWPADARHVTALDLKTSTQVLAVPEQ